MRCSFRKNKLSDKPYNTASGRGAGNVPLQKEPPPVELLPPCALKKANVPVANGASSKGYGNQKGAKPLASPLRGEGHPLGERCPTSGWWVARVCRVTRLLRREVLNSRCCLLGQRDCKGQGRCFVLFCFKKPNLSKKTKNSPSSLCAPSCTCVKVISIP